jgi:hypothetical protein
MGWLNKLKEQWRTNRVAPTNRSRLKIEGMENRDMPAVGLLQGFSFLDQNANGVNDPSDPKNVGVTINLRNSEGSVVASTRTDGEGYYAFTGVKAGQYTVEQATPTSQVSSGVQVSTIVTKATATSLNAARVTIPATDPSQLKLNRVGGAAGNVTGANAAFTLTGGPFNNFTKLASKDSAVQYELFLTAGSQNERISPNFLGYCVDLFNANPDGFSVQTSQRPAIPASALQPRGALTPTTTENLGRIGYLVNNFARTLQTTGREQAGMALAIYELTYDSRTDLTAGNFRALPGTDAAVISEAQRFLHLSNGKHQGAIYFNVVTTNAGNFGQQGMVTSELINFANKTPVIPPVPPAPQGQIDLEKFVKDASSKTAGFGDDADQGPGPSIPVGSSVQFTYVVTNTGKAALTHVNLVDDNGTPNNPRDDFRPSPTLTKAGFNVGDANNNHVLDVGEKWIYTFCEPVCTVGLQTNIGVVTAKVAGTTTTVTDRDAANYTATRVSVPDKNGSKGKGSNGKGSKGKGSSSKGSKGKGSSDKGSSGKGSSSKGSKGKGSSSKGSKGKGSSSKGSKGKGSSGKGSSDKSSKIKCEPGNPPSQGSKGKGSSSKGSKGKGSSNKGSSSKGSKSKGSSGKGSSSKASKIKCDSGSTPSKGSKSKGSSSKGSKSKGSSGKGSSDKSSKIKCDTGSSSKGSKSKGSSSKGSKSKGSSGKGSFGKGSSSKSSKGKGSSGKGSSSKGSKSKGSSSKSSKGKSGSRKGSSSKSSKGKGSSGKPHQLPNCPPGMSGSKKDILKSLYGIK